MRVGVKTGGRLLEGLTSIGKVKEALSAEESLDLPSLTCITREVFPKNSGLILTWKESSPDILTPPANPAPKVMALAE